MIAQDWKYVSVDGFLCPNNHYVDLHHVIDSAEEVDCPHCVAEDEAEEGEPVIGTIRERVAGEPFKLLGYKPGWYYWSGHTWVGPYKTEESVRRLLTSG